MIWNGGEELLLPFSKRQKKSPRVFREPHKHKGMNKGTTIAKRRQYLRDANEQQDFLTRNYSVYLIISFLIYPLAAVYSAATEGGHLYTRFLDTMTNPWLAGGATLLLVIMIETGVIVFGRSVTNDLVEGVWGEDPAYKQMFFAKSVLFLACFAFSTTLSIQGARETTNALRTNLTPPTLVDADSVSARYDQQVALQLSTIEDARKMTWRGAITRKGQSIIDDARTSIDNIEAERSAALAAVANTNNNTTAEWEARTYSHGTWATALGGLGQLIQLLALIIGGIYRAGENNLVRNLEHITGRDIDGDGIVGHPTPPAAELDYDQIAGAVASRIQGEQQRKRVAGFTPTPEDRLPKSEPIGPVAEAVQIPVAPVAQPTQPVTTVQTETVHVVVSDLKKEITTYYPRCFSKEVTEKGSKYLDTQQKNRHRVEAKIKELRTYGIEANVNFETYQTPITWKSTN